MKDIFSLKEFKVIAILLLVTAIGFAYDFNDKCNDENVVKLNKSVEKSIKISYDYKTITFEELQTLPKIGKVKAKAIIEYRNKNGFEKFEDILNVKGIGKKTLSKLAKYFGKSKKIEIKKNNLEKSKKNICKKSFRNDLNNALISDLIKVKGIGIKKATRILKYKKDKGKFKNWNDVLNVKGIGPKTIIKMQKLFKIGGVNE